MAEGLELVVTAPRRRLRRGRHVVALLAELAVVREAATRYRRASHLSGEEASARVVEAVKTVLGVRGGMNLTDSRPEPAAGSGTADPRVGTV